MRAADEAAPAMRWLPVQCGVFTGKLYCETRPSCVKNRDVDGDVDGRFAVDAVNDNDLDPSPGIDEEEDGGRAACTVRVRSLQSECFWATRTGELAASVIEAEESVQLDVVDTGDARCLLRLRGGHRKYVVWRGNGVAAWAARPGATRFVFLPVSTPQYYNIE